MDEAGHLDCSGKVYFPHEAKDQSIASVLRIPALRARRGFLAERAGDRPRTENAGHARP